ncbi:MAG: FkbM family methyltransferase [Rhodospirillaceae bacterium]|nr:FkbM family methyltransferase [Rhodospirillales bacterium]
MRTNLFRNTAFAPVYEAAGLSAMDIGSRGGFDAELLPIAWAVDCMGFEPEPEAFAQLAALNPAPWRSLRWVPSAVGPETGSATLHLPANPIGASLLAHDPEIGVRFGLEALTTVERRLTVDTVTLDEAMTRWSLPAPAYLKLDVEGAELSILQSAPRVLSHMTALKTEASFIPARKDQPLAADLDVFLRGHGFVLMDILHPQRWRHQPLPPHPYSWAGAPAYSRGQIAQCDLLYFRDPAAIPAEDGETALQAGLIAMAFGFFDHALDLFERPAVAQALAAHGVDFRRETAIISRRCGRFAAMAAIRHHLRNMVPLLRSLTLGVPG